MSQLAPGRFATAAFDLDPALTKSPSFDTLTAIKPQKQLALCLERLAMRSITKQTRIAVLGFLTMFLVSCETQFTEYRGQNIVGGKGGTVKVVEGIDFWETGEPDRKCRIVGEILDDGESDSAIAKVVRKHGGNAVIHAGMDRLGNVDSRMRTKLIVVKYVE